MVVRSIVDLVDFLDSLDWIKVPKLELVTYPAALLNVVMLFQRFSKYMLPGRA